MATQGTATIDFGAACTDRASVVVTGQAGILSGSQVEAWLMAVGNAENGVDAHILAATLMNLITGNIVAGTGFTIYAVCDARASGKFTLQWVWS